MNDTDDIYRIDHVSIYDNGFSCWMKPRKLYIAIDYIEGIAYTNGEKVKESKMHKEASIRVEMLRDQYKNVMKGRLL